MGNTQSQSADYLPKKLTSGQPWLSWRNESEKKKMLFELK